MAEVGRAYGTLVGVAIGCGLLIAAVFEGTREPIEHNQAQALQNAISQVLPGSRTRLPLALTAQDELIEVDDPMTKPGAYQTRNGAGDLLGYAVRASGMGYQDQIHLLYGYDPRAAKLTGYVVLDSRETPGLGSRISTDERFLSGFKDRELRLDSSGRVSPTLKIVSSGAANQPWEIDGITGATVSSRAVARILNDSLARWLPRIHASSIGS